MKRNIRSLSLLLAGSFFLIGAGGRVKKGVEVEGVLVGDMPVAQAERRICEIFRDRLSFTVRTPTGECSVQGLEFSGLKNALARAKRGERLSLTPVWGNMEEELLRICTAHAREAKNAKIFFSEQGFSYEEEQTGVACDYQKLLQDAVCAIANGEREITLNTYEYEPTFRLADAYNHTALLSDFSTYYDEGNAPRAHNIALAMQKLSGAVIPPYGELSFNQTVGERTEENGFAVASVILEGEFVPGVGGGVCQASTTLFNGALCAGLQAVESHAHSLSVGYIAPSLDAMVSEWNDLRLFNPFPTPVYLLAEAQEGRARVRFYGLKSGISYATESVVLLRVKPPSPKQIVGERAETVRAEKEGIASESYLSAYEGERLLYRKRIRRDSYAAVQGIIKVLPDGAENGKNKG